MTRMTGLDASFLYMESPRLPMHTLKFGVLDLGGVPGGLRFDRVLEVRRAHLHPRLARPPVHLVVSNVPGPAAPLLVEGARLVRLASVGPLLEGVGLNVTVWSYRDTLCFSVLACAEAVPDLPALAVELRAAIEPLEAATAALDAAAPRP